MENREKTKMTNIELTSDQEGRVVEETLKNLGLPTLSELVKQYSKQSSLRAEQDSQIKQLKGGKKNMVMREIEPGVWKPENKGDKIKGVFISKDENVGDFDSTIYHLDVDGSPMSVWGSAALKPKMVGIKAGTVVEIEYIGTAPSKKGADTKLFKVSADDGEEESVPVEKVGELPAQ